MFRAIFALIIKSILTAITASEFSSYSAMTAADDTRE